MKINKKVEVDVGMDFKSSFGSSIGRFFANIVKGIFIIGFILVLVILFPE